MEDTTFDILFSDSSVTRVSKYIVVSAYLENSKWPLQ
jgi:hypothetical protein